MSDVETTKSHFRERIHLRLATLVTCLVWSMVVHADHHLWDIQEVYSNGDGSVQYVELTSSASGQGVLTGRTLISSSPTSMDTFTFPSDLSGDTASKSLLLATADFAAITGLTPDFTLPAGFVQRASGSLNFAAGADVLEIALGALPLNGLQALSRDGSPVTASPTNFAGLSATVNAPIRASFDPASAVMNVPMLDAPGIGRANLSFAVDLATLQFTLLDNLYFYQAGISAGDTPAELRDGGVVYIPALVFDGQLFEFSLTIIAENPVVLGNPAILGSGPLPPLPEPEPVPEPQPNPLQDSINRGQTQFNAQCRTCHGANGGGGAGGPSLLGLGFNFLRSETNNRMPLGNPSACVDSGSSTCATDVSNYIINVLQN